MNDSSNNTSGGIGFFGLLGIVFIVLKLVGVIDWPWIWVLSPIWGGIVIGTIVFLIVLMIIKWINEKGR